MADVCDIALCFVVLGTAVVVAWPLWAVDQTLANASGRMDRARVRLRVRRYAARNELDEGSLIEAVSHMVRAAEGQGIVINDIEAFYAVKAALALSAASTIPIHKAIELMAANL